MDFYNPTILNKIGSKFGKVQKIDARTLNNKWGRFARLCVLAGMKKLLVPFIRIDKKHT